MSVAVAVQAGHVYGGAFHLSLLIILSDGRSMGCDVAYDFNATPAQNQTTIVNRVKQSVTDTFGVTLGAGSKVALVGLPTNVTL